MAKRKNEFPVPKRKKKVFTRKTPKKPTLAQQLSESAQQVFDDAHNRYWDSAYSEGYFNAGENLALDLLSQEVLEGDGSGRQFHGVYLPMLYCYRHFLELSLKHLIEILVPLSDLDPKLDLQKTHKLMPLWREAKRHMEIVFDPPAAGEETYDDVEAQLDEFHEFDPSAQKFRYRHDTQGCPQEYSIPTAVLPELIEVMRGFRACLSDLEGRAWRAEQSLQDKRSMI